MISHMDAAVGTDRRPDRRTRTCGQHAHICSPAITARRGSGWAAPIPISSTRPVRCAGARGRSTKAASACRSSRRWPGKIPAGGNRITWRLSGICCRRCARLPTSKRRANIDGISFAPTLFGNGQASRSTNICTGSFRRTISSKPFAPAIGRSVRSGVDRGDPPFELYDLSPDIGEQHNVAAEHPDVVERLEVAAKPTRRRSCSRSWHRRGRRTVKQSCSAYRT